MSTLRRLPLWIGDVVADWHWRHTIAGAVIGLLAMFIFNQASIAAYLLFKKEPNPYLAWALWNTFQFGWPAVLAMRVADRAAAEGVARWLAYGTALALVLLLGASVLAAPISLLFDVLSDPTLLTRPGDMLEALWQASRLDLALLGSRLPGAIPCTFAYAQWQRQRQAQARLRQTALARAQQEQALQAQRLLALQARVEPELLFEALRRVRDGLGRAPAAASALLDDLIVFLRAMQPPVGAVASTVRREFALATAFLRVQQALGARVNEPPLAVAPDAQGAALAPLVLLPMVRTLLATPGSDWRIDATRAGDRLAVGVTCGTPGADARRALAAIDLPALHERLRAVHGDDARCTLDAAAARLTLDLPLSLDDDARTDR